MSIRVMTQVWANSQHKGSALILLLAIADFADDGGYAHPGIETLAEKCRMSERNTRYVIDRLTESRELVVQKNTGRGGTNEYWITLNPNLPLFVEKGAKTKRVQSLHPGNPASERVQPASEKGATAIAPEPSGTKEEPSSMRRLPADADFEQVWQALPKRAGNNPKKKAQRAYRARIAEGCTLQAMLHGAWRYARFCNATGKDGTEFVMQGATFLGPERAFLQPWAISAARPRWDATSDGIVAKANELGISTRGETAETLKAQIRDRLVEAARPDTIA